MTNDEPIDIIRSEEHEGTVSKRSSQCRREIDQDPSSAQDEQNSGDLEAKYEKDVPPDGGYGWVCVACVFWINAHTWGINSVRSLAGSKVYNESGC